MYKYNVWDLFSYFFFVLIKFLIYDNLMYICIEYISVYGVKYFCAMKSFNKFINLTLRKKKFNLLN